MKKIAPLLLLLLLSACTPATNAPPVSVSGPLPSPTPAAATAPPAPDATPAVSSELGADDPAAWCAALSTADLPTQESTLAEILSASGPQLFLLADLPAYDVALYGLYGWDNGRGVVLRHGDTLTYFDQIYMPNVEPLLPEAWWRDFDGDGQDELAVKYQIYNHTRSQVFELHIYEQDGEGWTDHGLTDAEVNERLTQMVGYAFDQENGSVTASVGGTEASIFLDEYGLSDPTAGYALGFFDRTFYRYEDGSFTGVYGLGLQQPGMGTYQYFGAVLATIDYDGTALNLKDLRIESYLT